MTDQRWGVQLAGDHARARLWAPSSTSVAVLVANGETVPMAAAGEGWFEGSIVGMQPGDRYKFVVDGTPVPDPASRSQPEGPDGWSELVALDRYQWQSSDWAGRPWRETVLYELHIGTFTKAGTFAAAIDHLDHLVRLGVTMIELMPIGTFPGARNWGYDGVLPFAPDRAYGAPEELQRLVDACHARGLSIVLDVVYNHFGPESTHIERYAKPFFTDRHHTPWGAAINFDGLHAAPVRAFYCQNAVMWLDEYRFDGLRLDAVQAIKDDSEPPFLAELSQAVRTQASGRPVHLMLENDLNEARWLSAGGYEAQWNDDFHHVMRVLLAGQTDGYYEDYATDPIDHLGRALTEGFSYQGQESKHRPGMFRGTPSGHLPPLAFVNFLQNHDQVGNAPYGQRLSRLAPPEAVRLGAAVLILAPGIPMLFMGEEWAANTPFDFFCDYGGALADAVRNGRRDEFKRFAEFRTEAALARLSDPIDPATAARSALDWSEPRRSPHDATLSLHTELLAARARYLVPLLEQIEAGASRYVRLSERAIAVSWTAGSASWQIAANFSSQPASYVAPPGEVVFTLEERGPGQLGGWGFSASIARS